MDHETWGDEKLNAMKEIIFKNLNRYTVDVHTTMTSLGKTFIATFLSFQDMSFCPRSFSSSFFR